MIEAHLDERADGVCLVLRGCWTVSHAASGRERLIELLSARAPQTLDLSGIDDVDSAGLQLLLALARRQAACGRLPDVVGQSPAVQRLGSALGICGPTQAFGMAVRLQRPDPEAGLCAMGDAQGATP